ncbi:g4166 [Coccomyxa viridis]|uniref:G4166 protein n=1 Tax=Coccomyxa viridis TaxID=1274662 RepID=A0ABP1FSU3_9CHLO
MCAHTIEPQGQDAGLPINLLGKDLQIVLGKSFLQVAGKRICEQDCIAVFDRDHWRLELMSSVSNDISLPVVEVSGAMALTEGMRMSSEAVTEAAVKERLPCEEATAPVAADEDAELERPDFIPEDEWNAMPAHFREFCT